MLRSYDRHHIARTIEIHVLAVVPLPTHGARAAVKATQISIPSAKDHILAVNYRLSLAIVVDVVILPQQTVTLHVPSLEHLETTLIQDTIIHEAVGNVGTSSIILPLDLT